MVLFLLILSPEPPSLMAGKARGRGWTVKPLFYLNGIAIAMPFKC